MVVSITVIKIWKDDLIFYEAELNKWEKDFKRLQSLDTHKDNFPEQSLQVHIFDLGISDKMPSQWLF